MNDGPQTADKKNIMIGLPSYDSRIEIGTAFCITRASQKPEHNCVIRTADSSSLTKCFNNLWCEALNDRKNGLTHFAMIHADIVAEHGWLDKMLALMDKHGADVISAVVPLKNTQGYTSTALDESTADSGADHFKISNLSMHEVFRMKESTFTDPELLINTGLMIVDMRKPWVEQIAFRFENENIKIGEEFKPFEISEDWYFSRQARKLGAKIFATREIVVKHMGRAAYTNAKAWGTAGLEIKPSMN